MLLIIHNLPGHLHIPDIKELIKEKCGLTELILDNLISEGLCNRVTVGLADEADAALLVRKINGLFIQGSQLYVEDLRQKKSSDQPYFPNQNDMQQQANMQQTSQFQESNMNMMQFPGGITSLPPPPTMPMSYNNLPFYMTPIQNSSTNYEAQSSLPTNPLQQVPYYQQDILSYGYPQPNAQTAWNQELITSYPEKQVMQSQTVSNTADSYLPSVDNKRGNGKDLHSYYKDNRDNSGPSKNYNDVPDRNRNPYKVDNRKNRSGMNFDQQKDRRNEQSPPRGNDRRGKKPIPKRNNDVEKPRRSHLDRSPPRDRYLENDRFRSQSGRESGNDESEQQRDFDRRDSFRDFGEYDQRRTYDKQKQKNFEQDNFGKKTQPKYSNKTYSSDPNNSTFSKPKVNYGQQAAFTRFSETDIRDSPSKVAKFSNEGNSGQLGFATLNSNVNEIVMKTKLAAHTNYRNKATKLLARHVICNARVGKIDNFKQMLRNMQKCIQSRIDVILGDRIVTSFAEVIDVYRRNFNISGDGEFYAAVVEKLERDKEFSALQSPDSDIKIENPGKPPIDPNNTGNMEQPSTSAALDPLKSNYYNKLKAKEALALGKDTQQNVQNAPVPTQEPRLPKYPKASKEVFKVQKRTTKLEYQKDIYNMDKKLQSALEAEIVELRKQFKAGCANPQGAAEKNIRHRLITETVQEFLKVTQVHVKKRLLNISNNLVIRIFCVPKPPRRELMDAALKDLGIESLRKSERKRIFIATCNSFESYDRILAQQMLNIGEFTLKFKPLHLVGPPIKKHSKEAKELKSEVRQLTEVDLDNGGESDGFEFDDDYNEVNQSDDDIDEKPDESDEKLDEKDKKLDEKDKKLDEKDKKLDESDVIQNKSDEDHKKPLGSCNLGDGGTDVFNDSDIVFVENKNEVLVIDDNEKFVDADVSSAVSTKEAVAIAIKCDDKQTNDKITESITQKCESKDDIATDGQNIENDLPEIITADIAEDDLEDF